MMSNRSAARTAAAAVLASALSLLAEGSTEMHEAMKRFESRHPGVSRVGGDVTPPRVIQKVHPQFPKKRLSFRQFTPIVLEAVITETGEVADPTIVMSGHPDLDPIVLAAVRQWKYEPARRKGKPVAVFLTVSVTLDPAPA